MIDFVLFSTVNEQLHALACRVRYAYKEPLIQMFDVATGRTVILDIKVVLFPKLRSKEVSNWPFANPVLRHTHDDLVAAALRYDVDVWGDRITVPVEPHNFQLQLQGH